MVAYILKSLALVIFIVLFEIVMINAGIGMNNAGWLPLKMSFLETPTRHRL
jgi:hypothetical protein